MDRTLGCGFWKNAIHMWRRRCHTIIVLSRLVLSQSLILRKCWRITGHELKQRGETRLCNVHTTLMRPGRVLRQCGTKMFSTRKCRTPCYGFWKNAIGSSGIEWGPPNQGSPILIGEKAVAISALVIGEHAVSAARNISSCAWASVIVACSRCSSLEGVGGERALERLLGECERVRLCESSCDSCVRCGARAGVGTVFSCVDGE